MTLKAIWKRTMLSTLNSNSTINFDFGEPVTPIMFGLTGFSLSFPDSKGHNVAWMQASATLGTGASGVVPLAMTAKMYDNGGNQADPDSTYIDYTVLGWTGSSAGIISMGTGSLQNSGTNYSPSSVPTTIVTSVPALGGFQANYPSDDNQVMTVSGSASLSGTEVALSGQMVDNDRKHVADAQLIGGELLVGVKNPGFAIKTISNQQSSNNVTVEFADVLPSGSRLLGCASFLTAFSVSYPDGDAHDVNTIRIGPQSSTGQAYVSGTKVIIPGPRATMWDCGHPSHEQDDSISNVSMAVIGIYA